MDIEEISIGEYIRTKSGLVGELIKIDEDGWYVIKHNWLIDGYPVNKNEIVNHSKNKIDLVEVGDYVNGKRVFATNNRINDNGEKVILTENYDEWTDDGVVSNKDIKSIVTKEKYKSVEYVF